MNQPLSTTSPPRAGDRVLDDLFEQITAKVQAGEPVDVEAYVRDFPELAERIRQLVPAIEALAELGLSAVYDTSGAPRPATREPVTGLLGDFRILREIGRGGMGLVYEAEQISLGRRVALKVLPFAAVLDPKQLQRFKNEAQAAASLDHANIVDVLSVGCERGVHYYAMKYIEGQTLAEVISQGSGVRDQGQPFIASIASLWRLVFVSLGFVLSRHGCVSSYSCACRASSWDASGSWRTERAECAAPC